MVNQMSEILNLLFKEQPFYLTQSFGSTKGTDYPLANVDFHNGEDYSMNPQGSSVLKTYAIADGKISANGRTDYRGYYIDIFYPLYNKTMRLMHSSTQSPLGVGTTVKQGDFLLMEGNVGIGVTGFHHHIGWFSGEAGNEEYEAISKQAVIRSDIPNVIINAKTVTFTESPYVNVRTSPSLNGTIREKYSPGEILKNITNHHIAEGYVWAEYLSSTGIISFVAIYDIVNLKSFVEVGSNKVMQFLVFDSSLTKVSVWDYNEGTFVGYLNPKKFGGLEYEVLEISSNGDRIILTRDFGKVRINKNDGILLEK